MSDFPFLSDLCESRLIPSHSLLKRWKSTKLAELCYLYFIALRILLCDDHAKQWARDYCKKAGEPNDFATWRTAGNDLYVMLYALNDADKVNISPSLIRRWLRHVAIADAEDDTRRLFMRLDTMFNIGSSSERSMRRAVLDWDDVDPEERETIVTKLVQLIHNLAPYNSEVLPHLKKLSLHESATTGATGSSSVATVAGGLGAGFDPDGDWRSVYPKKKKPIVLRRVQERS
jgi:hypothetical protein